MTDDVEKIAKRLNRYAKIVPYMVGAVWLITLGIIVTILSMVLTWK